MWADYLKIKHNNKLSLYTTIIYHGTTTEKHNHMSTLCVFFIVTTKSIYFSHYSEIQPLTVIA